jgi:hypothetical protein
MMRMLQRHVKHRRREGIPEHGYSACGARRLEDQRKERMLAVRFINGGTEMACAM